MPYMLYNNNNKIKVIWEEANCFFVKTKTKMLHMNQKKFSTEKKFRLLVDLGSMADHSWHDSEMYLVNTKGLVQVELEWKGRGWVKCHVFVVSELKVNIQERQLKSVEL